MELWKRQNGKGQNGASEVLRCPVTFSSHDENPASPALPSQFGSYFDCEFSYCNSQSECRVPSRFRANGDVQFPVLYLHLTTAVLLGMFENA